MVDLNKELNEYLLKSKNGEQFEISVSSESESPSVVERLFGKNKQKREEDQRWYKKFTGECFPNMTRMQRIVACITCSVAGIICILLSTMYLPVLLINGRKFAALFTLGSILMLLSLVFLWGPINYLKYLFSNERRYYAIFYFGTLIGTLYCALYLKSTALTSLCSILEIIAMISFFVSSLPGGTTGLSLFGRLFGRIFKSSISSTLPI